MKKIPSVYLNHGFENHPPHNQRLSASKRFRNLSRRYFKHERHVTLLIELALFAVIVAVSTWPMISAANAIDQLLR